MSWFRCRLWSNSTHCVLKIPWKSDCHPGLVCWATIDCMYRGSVKIEGLITNVLQTLRNWHIIDTSVGHPCLFFISFISDCNSLSHVRLALSTWHWRTWSVFSGSIERRHILWLWCLVCHRCHPVPIRPVIHLLIQIFIFLFIPARLVCSTFQSIDDSLHWGIFVL